MVERPVVPDLAAAELAEAVERAVNALNIAIRDAERAGWSVEVEVDLFPDYTTGPRDPATVVRAATRWRYRPAADRRG